MEGGMRMADREKVIRGLERCLKHTCPEIDSKEYRDCEYTIGFYCGQDKLMRDSLALLKEQEEEISRISKAYLDIAGKASKKTEIVRCKDCKHRPVKPKDFENGFDLEFPDGKCPCQCDDGWYSWHPSDDWFCADGERKEGW